MVLHLEVLDDFLFALEEGIEAGDAFPRR